MKALYIISLFFFLYPLTAQTPEGIEVQSVIENMYEDIYSKSKINKIEDYFSNDATIFSDGEVFDFELWKSFIKNLSENLSAENQNGNVLERINHFDFLNILVSGNYASIAYKKTEDFIYNGTKLVQLNWLESADLVKENNNWEIKFLHTTRIKQDN